MTKNIELANLIYVYTPPNVSPFFSPHHILLALRHQHREEYKTKLDRQWYKSVDCFDLGSTRHQSLLKKSGLMKNCWGLRALRTAVPTGYHWWPERPPTHHPHPPSRLHCNRRATQPLTNGQGIEKGHYRAT